jgi:hypothetical protein
VSLNITVFDKNFHLIHDGYVHLASVYDLDIFILLSGNLMAPPTVKLGFGKSDATELLF